MYKLGACYENEEGVPAKSLSEALRLYLLAEETDPNIDRATISSYGRSSTTWHTGM